MSENKWKQFFLAAVAFAAIAQVVRTIGSMLTMNYYLDPAYFPLWSKLMMPGPSGPGIEFFATSIVFNLIVGFIFATAFSLLFNSIPEGRLGKGFNYGVLLFLVVGVPFALTTYLLFAVPSFLILEWALESLVIYVASGFVFAKLLNQ